MSRFECAKVDSVTFVTEIRDLVSFLRKLIWSHVAALRVAAEPPFSTRSEWWTPGLALLCASFCWYCYLIVFEKYVGVDAALIALCARPEEYTGVSYIL